MPKLSTRKVLAVFISLGVVLAIFTSVQGVSASRSEIGSHLVSGAMVNLNHDRYTISELETYQSQLDTYYGDPRGDGGHDCQSKNQPNPNDY